jgi:hypothetical protein
MKSIKTIPGKSVSTVIEIEAADLGKGWRNLPNGVMETMGRLQPGDVGKRCYLRGDVWQVENDAQRDARLAREARNPLIAPDDFRVENHGSIVLVRPLSERCRAWLKASVQDGAQWWAGALAAEPRYVADLLLGMADEGFLRAE